MQNINSNFKVDIIKRCYQFSLNIINFLEGYSTNMVNDVLSKQLIRSSTSIGANIVEGKAASSRLEYKKFYEIALRSANESKYWLCLLRDKKSTSKQVQVKITKLLDENIQIANILAKGVISLKKKL